MSTTATLQHTIQIRPSRFAAILVAVAVLTGVSTWSVSNAVDDSAGAPQSSAVSSTYVDEVTALAPTERVAIYGNVPTDRERADAVSRLSPEQQAAVFGNVSPSQQYVDGIIALNPTQLAAGFGNVSTP